MRNSFAIGLISFRLALCTLAAGEPPNFLVIMGEAQGWASTSAPLDDRDKQGSRSDYIHTPNLDALAERGFRFSDFYASSPRCTPTRAAMFTGRSPAALHMTFVGEGKKDGVVNPGDKVIPPDSTTQLPEHIETVGTLLKKHGYATAHFGKWHVGRDNPKNCGFDENDGANSNGGPDNVEEPNPTQCYATAKLGMDFMTRQVKARKPFYLQISHYPGKQMEAATPEMIEAVKRRLGNRLDSQRIGRAAGNEEIDKTIGLVLTKLKELGAMENTYVIYTADHGAQGGNSNGALSKGKGTVWDGGLRVPLFVAGPGIKAGQFSHVRATTVDVLPTIMDLAGVKEQPKGLEGVSLVNVLQRDPNAAPKRVREELVIHFPHYDKDEIGPASAIIYQNYKMIRVFETEQRHLFDLSKDIAERHDLAGSKPEVVQDLDKRMMDYLRSVNAGLPKPNPNYDPKGERSGDRKGGGGGKGKGKKPNANAAALFRSGSHLLQSEFGNVTGIARPEVFAEEFEREPAVVADLSQEIEIASEIEMPLARHDAAMVVLFDASGSGRRVVEVGDGDGRGAEFGYGLKACAAAEAMEGIKHNAGLWMLRGGDHVDSGVDGIEVFDEAQVFEGGLHAEGQTHVEQLGMALADEAVVNHSGRRTGDDVDGAQRSGLIEATFAGFEFGGSDGVHSFSPAFEIDGGGHGQPVVIQRFADVRDLAALAEMKINVVMPQFDSSIADIASDADLVDDRRGANGARVQAVNEVGHERKSGRAGAGFLLSEPWANCRHRQVESVIES